MFLNLKTNQDAEQGGMYSASVVLTDASSGATLDTQTFTVQIQGEAGTSDQGTVGLGGFNSSTALYILINIILVVIAVFLIVLIFRGSSRRRKKKAASSTPKKMSDFEPAPKRRKK